MQETEHGNPKSHKLKHIDTKTVSLDDKIFENERQQEYHFGKSKQTGKRAECSPNRKSTSLSSLPSNN